MKAIATLALVTIAASFATGAQALPQTDKLAWQVFVQMMTPVPASHDVTYENWASDSDLYLTNPPHWPVAGTVKQLQRSVGGTTNVHMSGGIMKLAVASPSDCATPVDGPAANFPAGACIGEEVRHNYPAFRYLADNNLTTVAGLTKAYVSGKPVTLPADSVIAKADWVPVTDILKWLPQYKSATDVRRAYYVNSATSKGKTTDYALVGVSIQSHHMKDWVWTTFEHRSSPGRCDIIGCHDSFGAAQANVAPAPANNSDYGPCAKTLALQALFAQAHLDPIWANYCLKGVQTHYVDAKGQATLVGNSVIERMNHGVPIPQISCITCHSYAAFDARGHPNGAILEMKVKPTGAFDPKLLHGDKQGDFVWGLLLAQ